MGEVAELELPTQVSFQTDPALDLPGAIRVAIELILEEGALASPDLAADRWR